MAESASPATIVPRTLLCDEIFMGGALRIVG
jgi:hypothetical protein